jgi:hypothetical protein
MKYIIIITAILLTSCASWTPENYDWKSDYFKERYAVEIPVEPKEKIKPECSDCICNMELCT